MSQRRAKAKRASVVPKTLSLADRASAALESEQRRIEQDAGAAKRSAEARAIEEIRSLLHGRGIATIGQLVKAAVTADVHIDGPNVYAVPYATIEGLRFTIRGPQQGLALMLEVNCHLCGGSMWSQNISGLVALGMALKAKWQHPEGTCPRATESPRHSRHARKGT